MFAKMYLLRYNEEKGGDPMIYTLTLNPAVDYIVSLPEGLIPGTLNRAGSENVQFGGKGINVSRVLTALGVENVALGFLAGFTGEALEHALAEAGLETDFLWVSGGMTRINVKVRGSLETEINGRGPVVTAGDMARLYERMERLRQGDILVLSGSLAAGMEKDSCGEILKHLQGRGIRTVVDAAGESLRSALPCRPFLVKPNHLELGAFFGRELKNAEEMEACARELLRMGAENVLVSMGADGALLVDANGSAHRLAAPEGRVVSTVGAGDSMVAGFLAGWLRTGDYTQALKLGIAVGSATAFSLGLADRRSIEEVLASMG